MLKRLQDFLAKNRALVGIVVAALLGAGVTVVITSDDGTHTTTVHVGGGTVTTKVDGADPNRKPDQTVTVPKTDLAVAQATMEYTPSTLRAEHKPSPKAELTPALKVGPWKRALDAHRHNALPVAGASQGFPGCRTEFVVNQSSRHGVRPSQFWVHYTASPNRSGWGDVNAIVALFNRSSFQASSHFVIDNEGHCAYIVPIENKAWTQAGANAFGINVEYINSGSEGRYCAEPGCAKLRQVALEVKHRTGIPVGRIGAVSNCSPTRSGTVTHWMGGPCSGGHVDIKPYNLGALVAYFAKGGVVASSLTRYEQKVIRGGASPKGTGHSRRYWCHANGSLRLAIFHAAHKPGGGGYRARHRGARYQALGKSYRKRCR